MDSPRTWHVIFTGACYVIAAVIGAVVTYFLTIYFNKQIVAEPSTIEPGNTYTTSSPPNGEKHRLQKKITDLQGALAAEQLGRAEDQQRIAELETTKSAQKAKIADLELKISEMQSELEGAKSRFASEQSQLKKLSSDAQNRLDRARTNFKAGRIRVFPAPDGSARTITIVYDERGADVISPAIIARFRAGQ
jgi:multidrug efflux pump subunit AcrA (membrane-fusion protein)